MSVPRPIEGKITLLDQLIFVETEIEDLNIWQAVYHSEGSELPAGMAYRRRMCQQLARTLELVKLHEREIVGLVKSKRKSAPAPRSSIATSSASSTPRSAESEDDMEPSSEP